LKYLGVIGILALMVIGLSLEEKQSPLDTDAQIRPPVSIKEVGASEEVPPCVCDFLKTYKNFCESSLKASDGQN
jgi:hypothetical protein